MDKILIEIFIPAASESYDVFVPVNGKIYEITHLVKSTITEISQGYFIATQNTVLCELETGDVLNINKTVKELNLQNGAKLMLI